MISKRVKIIKVVLILVNIMFMGCSDKGYDNKLGIDNEAIEKNVTHGPMQSNGKYRCDFDKGDAIKLAPGEEVKPLTKDTQIRIWHFQNSDKYICLLLGDAIILTVPNN